MNSRFKTADQYIAGMDARVKDLQRHAQRCKEDDKINQNIAALFLGIGVAVTLFLLPSILDGNAMKTFFDYLF